MNKNFQLCSHNLFMIGFFCLFILVMAAYFISSEFQGGIVAFTTLPRCVINLYYILIHSWFWKNLIKIYHWVSGIKLSDFLSFINTICLNGTRYFINCIKKIFNFLQYGSGTHHVLLNPLSLTCTKRLFH